MIPTTINLLHYFLAIHNIHTLRQVFHLTAELHAAERVDALFGCGVDGRRVDAVRTSCDYNLALYNLSVEYDSTLLVIDHRSGRLRDSAVFQCDFLEVADRTFSSLCCYRSFADK